MTIAHAALGAALIAAIALPVLAADEAPVEVVTTQRAPLAAGGAVSIDETWGEVTIEGWDRPLVEVVMTRRSAKDHSPDEAADVRARLERFAATVEATAPDKVSIVGLSPSGSVSRPLGGKSAVKLRYTIRVPKSSRLALDNGAGVVRITGVGGDIDVDSDVGEVTIAGPVDAATAIEAKSGVGDVAVAGASAGKLRRVALVGQRYSYAPASPARRISVNLGVGSITID
jgi:hypothetical protein